MTMLQNINCKAFQGEYLMLRDIVLDLILAEHS